jgi:hypothetical protein
MAIIKDKAEWSKWIIGLLFLMMAATATNTAINSSLLVRVNKIQSDYVTSPEVVWFLKSYDAEKESMILFAAHDSIKGDAAIKASRLYNDLRNEAFRVMINSRGGSLKGSVSSK